MEVEALGEAENQLAHMIEEEKKNFNELREEVTKAKEQKRKKEEEYNQVCKEIQIAKHYRAVALDGTQFQPTGVISGGSSDLKVKAKKWDENHIRKMKDRRNVLQEELRTNAKGQLDVAMAMKRNKIMQLESRLKFTQQEKKKFTNTVQQQQEQKQQEKIIKKVIQAMFAPGPAVMTRQMQKNQQIQQKSQQIVAAAAAANRSLANSGISAAAAKLTTGPAAKRQKQQMGTTTPTSTIPSRGKPAKITSASVIPAVVPPKFEDQAQQPQKQQQQTCEICDDSQLADMDQYRIHLQEAHKQLLGKTASDMVQAAPWACCRCRERFWTYEGLERHLVMSHGLVTPDLLAKAQQNEDSSRCKLCGMSFGFNILQHLVTEHQVKLSSVEIMYSCDMCAFRSASYQQMESHLAKKHHSSKNMAN